jgi:short repeat uncharacterized protein DUF308
VVLVYPGISLLVLAVVLGVWLFAYGATQITAAFRIRSLAAHARAQVPQDGSWHVARACSAGLPAEAALK